MDKHVSKTQEVECRGLHNLMKNEDDKVSQMRTSYPGVWEHGGRLWSLHLFSPHFSMHFQKLSNVTENRFILHSSYVPAVFISLPDYDINISCSRCLYSCLKPVSYHPCSFSVVISVPEDYTLLLNAGRCDILFSFNHLGLSKSFKIVSCSLFSTNKGRQMLCPL